MPGTTPSEPQLGITRGGRIAIAVGAVLLLIAVAVVAGIVLLGGDEASKGISTDESDTTSTTTPADKASSSLDVPTIDPSDFPSDLPTTALSSDPGLPDPPSRLPTGFPDVPSFPTDSSGWEDWFSDYLEQVNP
ncbi:MULTISPECIES: hypothetical protein [unclassified Nocardioides]|uniref:hypothetical protein n=1 Tax=unclassified Nocardioides TaxID=2615069 RepID=UPI0007018ECF|nr:MULTISPECIES: hypothetical protein [unclassified Nocardioides]KRA38768.1 hypothetical protein ASD81_09250 [Nocardioides sp. Root614]KRA92728.1 hypothetical protein ASD84_09515 [Nocardioides sp. Root682]